LIVRLFRDILGYPNSRVLSEIEQNDVRILDRKRNPWLVIEVKKSLSNDSERQSARRQGFDYAHEHGMRYVVISDGDHYEIYDRFAGERLRYSEMRVGTFLMSSLKSRDHDLLALLAAES